MFLLGWFALCFFVILCMPAHGLEIFQHDSSEVICSQGLYHCTMMDDIALNLANNDDVDVQKLTTQFKLCCKDRGPCTLCMIIDIEINVTLDKASEDEALNDEYNYSENTGDAKAMFVTVCYSAGNIIPVCKKVEFTVTHTGLTQQNLGKISMVITRPAGVSFSSRVIVGSTETLHLPQEVVAPSLDKVCSHEVHKRVKECDVPRLSTVINHDLNQINLQPADSKKSLPSVCIQYENNGRCEKWNGDAIPLHSVTPCMCFQIWNNDDMAYRRTQSCPFNNTDFFQRNVWQNVSVSLGQGQMNNYRPMLRWNLSAPCRLEGEVWPCHKQGLGCWELQGFRQPLRKTTWRQNNKGHWERTGVFEDINLQLSPCVMIKVKGMRSALGPYCTAGRWRWSLLIIGLLLLVCLTVFMFCLLRVYVKKWAWSWHHTGFEKIGRKGPVVLLSPPNVDHGISVLMSELGSTLCNHGFSVSVDQWSRMEQCTLGPVPWLHSQLMQSNSLDERVVIVLTREAMKIAEEWTHQDKGAKWEGERHPQIGSPYSDVFKTSLFLIYTDKQLGRAGERFVLVNFDSGPHSQQTLPEPFQGLPLFQLPSQTQALLAELTVRGSGRGKRHRTWRLIANPKQEGRTAES